MDPVTHGLAGGLVGKTGLCSRLLPEELERRGVVWTGLFALAPDLDAIVELSGDPLAFLRYHRGLTHSFLGGGALAVVMALLFARLFPGVPRRKVLVLTATGVYLHIFLDLLTSYGTVLLFPFRSTRFTLDWLFTVDPTFTGILLVALLGVYLLRRAPRRVAKVGTMLAVGYITMCGLLQWHARQAVAAEAAALEIGGIRSVAALPAPFVPLNWTGIVETDDRYYQANLALGDGAASDIRFVEIPKVSAGAAPAALMAVRSEALREQVQVYEWAARFPTVSIERRADGQLVSFWDLRFNLPGLAPDQRPFLFTVRLNRDGEVVETVLQ